MVKKISIDEMAQVKCYLFGSIYGITHPGSNEWNARLKQFCKEHGGKVARIKVIIELIE